MSQRIISLLPSATEVLFELGLGERVVGISHECDYPAVVQTLPRVTRSCIDSTKSSSEIDHEVRGRLTAGLPLYELDSEILRQLRPDLIVTQRQCEVCAIDDAQVRRVLDD